MRPYQIKDANGNLLGYAKRRSLAGETNSGLKTQMEERGKIEKKRIALRSTYAMYDQNGNKKGEIKKRRYPLSQPIL